MLRPERLLGSRLDARPLTRLAAWALMVSCAQPGPTEPALPPLLEVQPALMTLGVSSFYSRLVAGGVLVVDASPLDTALRLQEHERLKLTIESSSGDTEQLWMGRQFVFEGPDPVDQSSLGVSMKPGRSYTELELALPPKRARVSLVSALGIVVGLRMMDARDRSQVERVLASHPAVSVWGRAGGAVVGPVGPILAKLVAAVPVEFGQPVPGDAVFQLQRGDSVRVSYSSQGNPVLTTMSRIP